MRSGKGNELVEGAKGSREQYEALTAFVNEKCSANLKIQMTQSRWRNWLGQYRSELHGYEQGKCEMFKEIHEVMVMLGHADPLPPDHPSLQERPPKLSKKRERQAKGARAPARKRARPEEQYYPSPMMPYANAPMDPLSSMYEASRLMMTPPPSDEAHVHLSQRSAFEKECGRAALDDDEEQGENAVEKLQFAAAKAGKEMSAQKFAKRAQLISQCLSNGMSPTEIEEMIKLADSDGSNVENKQQEEPANTEAPVAETEKASAEPVPEAAVSAGQQQE